MATAEAAESRAPVAGPRAVLLAVAGVALLAAGNALHVLGLLVGQGAFAVSATVRSVLPGLAPDLAPVPHRAVALDATLGFLASCGGRPLVLAATALLGLLTAALVLRALHPGLLTRLRQGTLPAGRLWPAFALSLGLLTAAFWRLPPDLGDTPFGAIRSALAVGLWWILWHPRGWLHDEAQPPSRWEVIGHLLAGTVVGLGLHTALQHRPFFVESDALVQWLEAGYDNPVAWGQVALHTFGFRIWLGLLAGCLVGLLVPAGVGPLRRLIWLSPALALVALLLGGGEVWRERVWVQQYDYGRALRDEVAQPYGPGSESEARVVALLERGGEPLPLARATRRSVAGLRMSRAMTENVEALLGRRHEQTCLATAAFQHLHDTATFAWDLPAALRIQQTQLASPATGPLVAALQIETLGHCADTPAARQAVERLLDPAQFSLTTRGAQERLAQIAWRWGRLVRLQGRDDVDLGARLAELAAEPAPRSDGVLTGRLLRGGAPWPKVRVGVIDYSRREELLGRVVTPWSQRLISGCTETAEDGSFRVLGLFEGSYALVLSVPADDFGPLRGLQVVGKLGKLTIDSLQRERSLGDLDVRPWTDSGPSVQVKAPGRAGAESSDA